MLLNCRFFLRRQLFQEIKSIILHQQHRQWKLINVWSFLHCWSNRFKKHAKDEQNDIQSQQGLRLY